MDELRQSDTERDGSGEEEEEEEEEEEILDEVHIEEEPYVRVNLNVFRVPNDQQLQTAYKIYKPSPVVLGLRSEQDRRFYPEEFLENHKLGTLADLAVSAYAKQLCPVTIPPQISDDPLQLRNFYDSLDVEFPLEKCYFVEDELYWKRVVLSITKDETTNQDKKYKWKNMGISMKYVELVEDCRAEYWPEAKMVALAQLVKEFVTHLHIRKLKPLEDWSFDQYINEKPPPKIKFDPEEKFENSTDISTPSTSGESNNEYPEAVEDTELNEEELEDIQQEKQLRRISKIQKRTAKEEQILRRAAREQRRLALEAELLKQNKTKKKKKNKKIKSVFDIVLETESENENEKEEVPDRRNIDKLVERRKKFKHPQEYCHHIDLSFIKHFENLNEILVEFKPPDLKRGFKQRYFNFSYQDIDNLANGVVELKYLKIFRLRNSRMGSIKLHTLSRALSCIKTLEIVDFGYDQLQDDCGFGLLELFSNTTSIKHLELEGNYLGFFTMQRLGEALSEYTGKLEYLGLAYNTLGDGGLHALVSAILGTEHITHLNLTAAVIDEDGVVCCISNELLRNHEILEQMDLVAIPMTPKAGLEIIKALVRNHKIQHMDCRGCDLIYEIEKDVEICLRRNQYIKENPYIGDEELAAEEIQTFVERMKNTVLIESMAALKKYQTCLDERPDDIRRYSKIAEPEEEPLEEEGIESIFVTTMDIKKESEAEAPTATMGLEEKPVEPKEPFVYDAANFTEEQFLRQVSMPGPGNRYFYMTRSEETLDKYELQDLYKLKS